jgi:glycerol-3-phosphate acyltransferase PlsY
VPAWTAGTEDPVPRHRYTSGLDPELAKVFRVAWFWSLCLVVLAYLLGSLSFAVIVSKAMGLDDPRSYGSGNPGATNVLRSGNRKAAIATLVLDALKGTVAVLFAAFMAPRLGVGPGTVAAAGLAAFIGHLYPVFFRFQGGKGVATAAGVLLALDVRLGLACLGTWLLVAVLTRYSSLAALVTAVLAPIIDVLVWGPTLRTDAVAVMSLLLVWRHRANIGKLMAGTESKIGSRAKTGEATPDSQDSSKDPS